MNSKMRIGIVINFTLVFFQLVIIPSHSQGNEFIIKLKSGVKISTSNILIEEGVVYYIFSSYGDKKVGIAQSAIAKILERKRSGALRTIHIPLKSKRYSRGTLAKQRGITKSLNKRSD